MDLAISSWLFVAALALHNIEDGVWLPARSENAGGRHTAVGARGEGYIARDRCMIAGPLVAAGIAASIPILFRIGRRA